MEFWNPKHQQAKTSRLHPQGSELNGLLRQLANQAEKIVASYQNAGN